MKIKNYVFGGVAVAIMVSAGITSANAALNLPSKDYVDTAITGVEGKIGTLSTLKTTDQSSTVGAINELHGTLQSVSDLVSGENGLIGGESSDLNSDGSLKDGSVTTPKLAGKAVTHDKLGDNAVQENNITDSSVTQGKIANGAVGTNQLADKAVTEGKLSDDLKGKIDSIAGKEDVGNKVGETISETDKGSQDKYPSMAAAQKLIDAALSSAGLAGGDGLDGSGLKDGTVTKTKLTSSLQAEINGKEDKSNKIESAEDAVTNRSNDTKYPSMAAADALAKNAALEALAEANLDDLVDEDGMINGSKIEDGTITEDKLSDAVKKTLGTLDNANCSAGGSCVLTWDGDKFIWTDIVDAQ